MKNWRQILNFFRSNWGKILRRSCKETKPAKLLLKWTEPAVIAIRTKPLRYPLPNHRPRIPTPSPGNKAARVLSTRTIQVRIIVRHRRQLVGTLFVRALSALMTLVCYSIVVEIALGNLCYNVYVYLFRTQHSWAIQVLQGSTKSPARGKLTHLWR